MKTKSYEVIEFQDLFENYELLKKYFLQTLYHYNLGDDVTTEISLISIEKLINYLDEYLKDCEENIEEFEIGKIEKELLNQFKKDMYFYKNLYIDVNVDLY